MTPERKKFLLEGEISSLQAILDDLNRKISLRKNILGLVGNSLRELTWAPEVFGGIPQIFSWNPPEHPVVQKIIRDLLLEEGGEPLEVNLRNNSVKISLSGGRLWISSPEKESILEAIQTWDLQVEDLSHPIEKISRMRDNIDYLEEYILLLFPLREVPKP
jgi:hypothetical protein